jgi:hypothetical protein
LGELLNIAKKTYEHQEANAYLNADGDIDFNNATTVLAEDDKPDNEDEVEMKQFKEE